MAWVQADDGGSDILQGSDNDRNIGIVVVEHESHHIYIYVYVCVRRLWEYTSNRHNISVALDPHGMLK